MNDTQRFSERNIAATGVGLVLLLLGVVSMHSHQTINSLLETDKWEEHSHRVLENINGLTHALKNVEWGHDYTIIGEESYLRTYEFEMQVVQETKNLGRLIKDPKQRQRFNDLQPLIAERMTLLQQSINLFQRDKSNTVMRVTLTAQEQQLQNQIFKLLDEMEANQRHLLQRRLLESSSSVHHTIILLISGYALIFGLLVGVFLLLQQRIRDRQRVEKALRQQALTLQESESILRSFYNSASMMMGIVEVLDDDILHISDNAATAEFFKLTPEAMHKQLASKMGVPQKYISELIYHYCQSESTGTPIHFEYAYDTSTERRWLSATVCLIAKTLSGRSRFSYIVEDITERKQAQEQIKASLAEKDVLLKEIHHRVKNNLQIVHSLLRLQFRRTKDEQAAEILLESQNRIKSMALIHENLYQSKDLSKIDLSVYIPILVEQLFNSYGINSNVISYKTKIDNIFLDIDTAIPCSLVINELISNSLKYAFVDGKGEIQIEFHCDNYNELTLIIKDNGIGIPENLVLAQTQSLGLKLVKSLVAQIEGSIDLDRLKGTNFKINFSAKNHDAR